MDGAKRLSRYTSTRTARAKELMMNIELALLLRLLVSKKDSHQITSFWVGLPTKSSWIPVFTGASACDARESETSALVWANIWTLQSGIRLPVHFHFDAISVGLAMTGSWNLRPDWLQGRKLREIVLFSQHLRVGCLHHYEHCKAHALQPCNELCDALAKMVCDSSSTLTSIVEPGLQWNMLFQDDDVRLSWAWWNVTYFTGHEYPPQKDDGLSISSSAGHHDVSCPTHLTVKTTEKQDTIRFRLKVGSYNTMTLHSRGEDGEILSESTRAAMLRQQLADAGYHVVGLQETRCNQQTVFSSDNFHRYTSGEDKERPGFWGCELWFRRGVTIAKSRSASFQFEAKNITILHSHPRLLLAHIKLGGHSIVFASGHAPHEGASDDEKDDWWNMLNSACSNYGHLGRWVVFGDFNSRFGCGGGDAIGDLVFEDADNDNGERMRSWCMDFDLWIPSTFSHHHTGESHTWTHPRGRQQTRLDYIVISSDMWSQVGSWVDYNIVTSNAVRDHELVGADLVWELDKYSTRTPTCQYDWDSMHTIEGKILLQQVVQSLPTVGWEVDVHTHWQQLEDALHQGLQKAFPPKPKPKRADIFSVQTWTLRDSKRNMKNGLVQLDDALDDIYIWMGWHAWKNHNTLVGQRRGNLLICMLIELARSLVLNCFRRSARDLRASLGRDKALFLESVIQKAEQQKGADIFQAIRPLRIGSNIRKRGMKTLPFLVDKEGTVAVDEWERDRLWSNHCAAMEAGVETTEKRLLQRARKRTLSLFEEVKEANIQLQQVPTLVELEGCFRRIKPRKAPGVDGIRSDVCGLAAAGLARKYHSLLSKMYIKCEEPIQLKGGLVISAFKGGKHTSVESYRSLLLSSHIGKALRRTLRQRLAPFYSANTNPFHCSVRQGGSVSHASQGLRLVLEGARRQGRAAGVIFVDVRAAYYRVIRELVVNMGDDHRSFDRLLRYFNLDATNETELMAAVSDGSVAEDLQIPGYLRNLLRESLSNTWFMSEQRSSIYECLAGSRPGDGLADVVFALIFRKILSCVQADFEERYGEATFELVSKFDVLEEEPPEVQVPSYLDVVWADDLAIAVTHKSPSQMIDRLRFVIARIFTHCLRHSMSPNLKKGKTEAMLFIRGPGSRSLRADFFNHEQPFLEIEGVPEDFGKVLVTSSYKHLGSRIHLGRGVLPEIKARLGAAATVYRKHRRAIFQNRNLSLERRRYLFSSMILSVVRYNTGTWGPLSSAERKYYVSRMMSMYRGLLRPEVPEEQLRLWNNNMVQAAVGLSDPLCFLHEARLSFATSAVCNGPPQLWTLAAAESNWLRGLRESKCWMHDQLRGCGPDRMGAMWNPDYLEEMSRRPQSFKRWIRRAAEHGRLQHRLQTYWSEWHHSYLLQLIQAGLNIDFPWPEGESRNDGDRAEACLKCHRVFGSRAAWAVHAFKCHGRTNDKRALIHTTRCEVCMKEFRSRDRLQRHLNYKLECAVQLRQAGLIFPIGPGINSGEGASKDVFPTPVLASAGPQRIWGEPAAEEWSDGVVEDFMEALFDCAESLDPSLDFDDIVQAFREVFANSDSAFSDLRFTFGKFRSECAAHWDTIRGDNTIRLAILDDALLWIERHLHIRWFFSEEECKSLPGAEELREAAWKFCNGRKCEQRTGAWKTFCKIPRFGYRQLTFLHFFSGESRAGDLQEAIGRIAIPSGYTRVVIAVDIIYDAVRADLTVRATQDKWISYIRQGLVDAVFSGPPCESWSKSRMNGGLPETEGGDGGPRVIRVAERPQGLMSLRIREVNQLILANVLLLFTMSAFLEILLIGKFGMVEHPAAPTDPREKWLPSIWKLFVVQCLQAHPGTRSVVVQQGYYGARSPKPTCLMFACGEGIDVEEILWRNRTCNSLPQALQMGKVNGEFATAALKNYPPDLCSAISSVLEEWIEQHVKDTATSNVDHPALLEFREYVQNLLVNFNYAAQRGADFAA